MQKQLTVIVTFLCLQFLFACQPTDDCGKCTEPAKVYIYKKSENDWIKIHKQSDNLSLSFSQNPGERLPLEVLEAGALDQVVRIKSVQKNASGGPKIEGKFKVKFEGENLSIEGLVPNKTLVFKPIKAEKLVLFLNVRKRVIKTGLKQSAFYKDKSVPENFYKNLAQVLCYYGEEYQTKDGKVYISALKYQDQERMWNYCNKTRDTEWLKEHVCKK